MNLNVEKRLKNGFTIVRINGYLNFESSNQLSQQFHILLSDGEIKVIFDFQNLEFVGSSGVSSFVKMLATFNERKHQPFYCGLKMEFIKLFRAFEGKTPFNIADEDISPDLLALSEQHLINILPYQNPSS